MLYTKRGNVKVKKSNQMIHSGKLLRKTSKNNLNLVRDKKEKFVRKCKTKNA